MGAGSGARVSAGGGAGWLASVDQISAAASNLLADVCRGALRASLASTISVSSVRANYPAVNMTGGKLFRQMLIELRTGNAARVARATRRGPGQWSDSNVRTLLVQGLCERWNRRTTGKILICSGALDLTFAS
jgi:hypothetical protein